MSEKEQMKKILLIEDDKFLATLLVQRLKEENISFDLASSGEEGLDKVRQTPFSLIVLDLVLPGIDGYEVLRQLKGDKELAKIPVIILSNLGQKEEIQRGLQLGSADFLVKAYFDLDQITKKIKEFLF